jgi:hypothetical protein
MSETAEIIEHEPKSRKPRSVAITETRTVTTPPEMLAMALQNGAAVETVERLMAMQERWEANQARKAFDAAIATAKGEIKPVVRNRAGHNNKGYADFAAIAKAVDPILAAHGLSYRFRTAQGERISVTCVLAHRDGHSEETTLTGPADKTGSKNDIQAIGSTLTYLQRYSLVQALGLAAADDDDGCAAGDDGVITDEQADQITGLLTETKSDVTAFLKWLRVESVSDIPLARFGEAIAKLQAKKARVAQ